jgi:hypothetical protein
MQGSDEKDTKMIEGVECIKVAPDIDYFQDLGAHILLEFIPNAITHGLTDPKQVTSCGGSPVGTPECPNLPHPTRLVFNNASIGESMKRLVILGLLLFCACLGNERDLLATQDNDLSPAFCG